MTSPRSLLILSFLTVSSQAGLEEVFFSPQDQTVREGDEVSFQCVSGKSSPAASITWLKDGQQVTRGRQIQGEYGGGSQMRTSGTLHLFNTTADDGGVYLCVTHDPSLNITRKSRPASLIVEGAPRRLKILHGPENITVAVGAEVSMHCSVHGLPVPVVQWFKDDCLLINCSTSFVLQNDGQLLTIRTLTKDDEGFYHCEASNLHETLKSQTAVLLLAEMDWSFRQQPTNVMVTKGENVTMTCRPPFSRPTAQVSWFKNNHLLGQTNRTRVLPSGDLQLHNVELNDSGTFFCKASNFLVQRFLTSRRATLTVLAHPSVNLQPQLLTVSRGEKVEMHCEVSGNPLPSIRWVKRGKSKQTGGKISTGLRNATLIIQSARSYDEGVYVCEASSSLGSSQSSAVLTVAVSPIIVAFSAQVTSKVGDSIVLPCRAVGIQPITYTWSRRTTETDTLLKNTEDRHVDHDGSLRISWVQRSYAGEYVCTAENRAGRQQRGNTLIVTAEEKQTGEDLSSTSSRQPISTSSGFVVEQQTKKGDKGTTCSGEECPGTAVLLSGGPVAELKMLPRSHDSHLSTTSPTLVTQMQSPTVTSPPHPNVQSITVHMPPTTSVSDPTTVQSLADESWGSLDPFTSVNPITLSTSTPTTRASHRPHTHPFARESEIHLPSTQAPTSSVSNLPEVQITGQPFLPTATASPRQSSDSHLLSQNSLLETQSFTLTESTTNLSRPVHSYNGTDGTDLSEWLKRNTSQSPMTSNSNPLATQRPESWLPTLEKHDIPIVVGVGLSLAFIFITVAFYSVVQKNEPAQTNRAVQRNLCVPMKKAEHQTAGRTYENRAFEDDGCTAVIEQSPNTSDTRARPPGLSLVAVQLEPTAESLQDLHPAPELHSVTVETYPEPITDTKIDPCLDEEKCRTPSPPSVLLQCEDDWISDGEDGRSLCQDALPPPSSLPSASPSPPPRREDSFSSSFTLHSSEQSMAPVHHHLSVSHATPPLFLSHQVSVGLTTVAVDLRFYPTAPPSRVPGTSTQANCGSSPNSMAPPLFSPPSSLCQENKLPHARLHPSK